MNAANPPEQSKGLGGNIGCKDKKCFAICRERRLSPDPSIPKSYSIRYTGFNQLRYFQDAHFILIMDVGKERHTIIGLW